MKQMSDKQFLDSNILIYAIGPEQTKKDQAIALLREKTICISTQVLAECANVCLKKLHFTTHQISEFFIDLIEQISIVQINTELLNQALNIHQRYQYSYYDSLVIAAALSAKCNILISEDFQHGHEIEGLIIINPFLK